ncbi:MAG: hypothetical protein RL391_1905, partial [Actinomycetota bacterium]
HIGSRLMNRRVDHECRPIHRHVAMDDFAMMIHEEKIADPHVAERQTERIDPEVIGLLGVAHGDVAGHALSETEPTEDAQGTGQALLAIEALLLERVERRQREKVRVAQSGVGDRVVLGRGHEPEVRASTLGHEHPGDHVNHAIGRRHIGGDDVDPVDLHLVAGLGDLQSLTLKRGELLAIHE